jgi:hypothetical protein
MSDCSVVSLGLPHSGRGRMARTLAPSPTTVVGGWEAVAVAALLADLVQGGAAGRLDGSVLRTASSPAMSPRRHRSPSSHPGPQWRSPRRPVSSGRRQPLLWKIGGGGRLNPTGCWSPLPEGHPGRRRHRRYRRRCCHRRPPPAAPDPRHGRQAAVCAPGGPGLTTLTRRRHPAQQLDTAAHQGIGNNTL